MSTRFDRRELFGLVGASASASLMATTLPPTVTSSAFIGAIEQQLHASSMTASAMCRRALAQCPDPGGLLVCNPSGLATLTEREVFTRRYSVEGVERDGGVGFDAVGLLSTSAVLTVRGEATSLLWTGGCVFDGLTALVFRRRTRTAFMVVSGVFRTPPRALRLSGPAASQIA